MANNELIVAVTGIDREKVFEEVKKALAEGVAPVDIIKACREGMDIILGKFERDEIFLVDVRNASVIVNDVADLIFEGQPDENRAYIGTMVICTVMNDVHQAGRIMTAELIRSIGVNVIDIGGDIPPANIVEAIKEYKADVLGLSGLVSSCIDPMKWTVDAVREAGLDTYIQIGGGQACEALRKYANADAVAMDMVEGARICQKYLASK